jgi:hypothetical protein
MNDHQMMAMERRASWEAIRPVLGKFMLKLFGLAVLAAVLAELL